MSTDTTYAGWPNYETWLASMWMINGQNWYYELYELIESDASLQKQSEMLRDIWRSKMDLLNIQAFFISDLLMHGFLRIDWLEIVTSNQK